MKFYYVPDGRKFEPCDDMKTAWEKSENHRRVAQDTIQNYFISTVFLVIDHSHDTGSPVLYETMVNDGQEWGDESRYRTWEEAYFGHINTVETIITRVSNRDVGLKITPLEEIFKNTLRHVQIQQTTPLETITTEIHEPHYFKEGRLYLDNYNSPPRATFGILGNIFYWRTLIDKAKCEYIVNWLDIADPKCDIMGIISHPEVERVQPPDHHI